MMKDVAAVRKEKNELYYGLKMAIPLLIMVVASMSPMFIRLVTPVENKDYVSTTVKLFILCAGLLVIVPKELGIVERTGWRENLEFIGFLGVKNLGKPLLTGLLLGCISIGGMVISSIIIGGYDFSLSLIDLKQVYFSLVPGIFEEVVFRGFIMVVLLRTFKSLPKAVGFQIFLFTISHMGDFTFWGIIDVLVVAVIALSFTYVVYKTGNLWAAIVFHFIHDAFLFAAQLPQDLYVGVRANALIYSFVVLSMIVIMFVVRLIYRKEAPESIYTKALAR